MLTAIVTDQKLQISQKVILVNTTLTLRHCDYGQYHLFMMFAVFDGLWTINRETVHQGLIIGRLITGEPYATLNVLSVFDYPKYSSITNMLFKVGLPNFKALTHNCKNKFC